MIITLSFVEICATEVSNFKAGLVCFDGKELLGVCHKTEDIYITGQGTCIWNQENKPCTWYGFSFDYKNAKQGTKILCKYKVSESITEGNFDGVRSENTNDGEFLINLENESGHFFNPQYFLFSGYYTSNQNSVIKTETTCAIDGKQVFSYKIKAHFPIQ